MDSTIIGLQNATFVERLTTFGELDATTQELLTAAVNVRKHAYCPYSKFAVGAAFRAESDERIFAGCNVENASFTPGTCAERSAIVKAISDGCQRFSAAAVVAYQPNSFTTPCGVCRQFIMEFSEQDVPIYVMKDADGVSPKNAREVVFCTSVYNLLPHGFRTFSE